MTDETEMSLDDIIKLNKNYRGRCGRKDVRSHRHNENLLQEGSRYWARSVASRTSRRGYARGEVSRRTTRNYINSTRVQEFFTGFESRKSDADKTVVEETTGPTNLMISNLHFEVSELDVQELFSEFGHLKESAIHYDNSGRSLGTAHVIFERNDDAVKAMRQYNGVPLDGQPMRIEMTFSHNPRPMRNMFLSRSIGGERAWAIPRGQFRILRGGTKSTGRGRSYSRAPMSQKKQLTAEDLDEELDAYAKKNPITM